MSNLNRRDFLKALGVTGGASALSACGIDDNRYYTPFESILPYVVRPEQVTPGTPTFFATSTTTGPNAWPVVANHREGRVINVGANLEAGFPSAVPKSAFFDLQRHYSPDRFRGPATVANGQRTETTWDDGLKQLAEAVKGARAAGKKVAWLGPYRSGAIVSLINDFTNGASVMWEAAGHAAEAKATELLFGERSLPVYNLAKAHYVLSFGADFLSHWGGAQAEIQYAEARDPNRGHFVTRFAAVTSHRDQTTANADDFFGAQPGSEALVALAVAKLVAEKKNYSGPAKSLVAAGDVAAAAAAAGIEASVIEGIANQFASAEAAVALPGGVLGASRAAVDLAAATYLLNIVSGNDGVTFGAAGGYSAPISTYEELAALIGEMKAGKIGVLLVDDVNPAYNLPAASEITEALAKVDLVVSLSSHPDETAALAGLSLPASDSFEDWGDEDLGGLKLLRQPAQTPLWDTRSIGDILLATARSAGVVAAGAAPAAPPAGETVEGEAPEAEGAEATEAAPMVAATLGFEPKTWRDYVRTHWERNIYPTSGDTTPFKRWWENTLQRGAFGAPAAPKASTLATTSFAFSGAGAVEGDGEFTLVAAPHGHVNDGRYSNQPWAWENADVMTGQVWNTFIQISKGTAARLNIAVGDLVSVSTPNGTLEGGAVVVPWQRDDVIVVPMGGGHTAAGRYAEGIGVNVATVLGAIVGDKGTLAWQQAKASLTAKGGKGDLVGVYGHEDDDGRQLAPVTEAGAMAAVGDAESHHPGELTGIHMLPRDERLEAAQKANPQGTFLDMYPLTDHPKYRWGLTVDLNACNGCGVCAIACYSENNLPVVGKEKVARGRAMNWLRINRYAGHDEEHLPSDIRFMPVMCQQCGHAPCEGVCPVLATYHTIDGLNAMVYNRCVGTRYCANACPYKARRFNYHSYVWPEPFNLQLNPEVSTRVMGVMEKCTFCVQRLKSTQSAYRDMGFTNLVPDEALQNLPACAEACPSQALTFGNLSDPESTVTKLRKSARSYEMLADLNVFSAVNYLSRATFHPPKAAHGGGHGEGGHADGGHDESHDAGHGEAAPSDKHENHDAAPAAGH